MNEEQAREIIKKDPGGNIKNRLDAKDVALEVLGEDCTMEEFWAWVDTGEKPQE